MCRRWRFLANLSLASMRALNLSRYFSVPCRLRHLSDAGFRQLLSRLPGLRRLMLGQAAAKLTRNGLLSIGKLCPLLIDLDISYMRLTYRSLEHLCRNSPRLQRVRLPRYFFSEKSLEVVIRCLRELRSLRLSSAYVVGSCFGNLPSSLRTISLQGCSGIDAANLQKIGMNCSQLTELSLSQTNVDSAALRGIALGCPCIQCLDVRWCAAVRLEDVAELLPDLRRLQAGYCRQFTYTSAHSLTTHCHKLHTVSLKVNRSSSQHCVSPPALQQLARLPQLQHLDISGQSDVTPHVLDSLALCPRLETLTMQRCSLTLSPDLETALVNMVSRCKSLSTLDVSFIGSITDRTYSRLAQTISPQRHLVLVARNTTLSSLSSSVVPAGHVTLCVSAATSRQSQRADSDEDVSDSESVGTVSDQMNELSYDSDHEDERLDERIFDAFADWLFVHNAFWDV